MRWMAAGPTPFGPALTAIPPHSALCPMMGGRRTFRVLTEFLPCQKSIRAPGRLAGRIQYRGLPTLASLRTKRGAGFEDS